MCYYALLLMSERLITNELKMKSIQQKGHQPVPTRSLREYLAHQSTLHSQSEEEHPPAGLEVEVDIGDGTIEVLLVHSTTDIQQQARQFC